MKSLQDITNTLTPSNRVQYNQQLPPNIQELLAQYLQSNNQQQPQQQQQVSTDNAPSPQNITPEGLQEMIQANGGLQGNATMDAGEWGTSSGEDGGDAIANAARVAVPKLNSSQNDVLNSLASGKGNIDYGAMQGMYPTPRAPIARSAQDLRDEYITAHPMKGNGNDLFASLYDAQNYANRYPAQQQAAYNQQLDARDLAAYNSAFKLAEASGKTQNEAARLAEEIVKDKNLADYQKGELGIRKSQLEMGKYKEPVIDASGQPWAFNQRTGSFDKLDVGDGTKFNQKGMAPGGKPLSATAEGQLKLGLDQFLGVKDAKGNALDNSKDIDPTQKNQILTAAESYLINNPTSGINGAIGHVINEQLGGLGSIKESETNIFSPSTPRGFSTIGKLNGTLPTSIGVSNEAIPTGGNLTQQITPNQAQIAIDTAKSKGASDSDLQKIANHFGLDYSGGKVVPRGWEGQ